MEESHNIKNLHIESVPEHTSIQKEPILEGELTGYPSIDKPWLKYYSEEAKNAELPRMSLYDYIWNRNKDNLDLVALNYFGKKITYKELFKNIEKVAKSFEKIGVKKGDVVSFCMPTVPETIYSMYALNKIGAISNMIDLTTNDDNIINRIKSTNSKYLIILDNMIEKIDNVVNNSKVEKVVYVSPTESLPKIIQVLSRLKENKKQNKKILNNNIYVDWKDFIKNYNCSLITEQIIYEENYPALIVYTGGTTGIPKGAVLSNDGINSTIVQLKQTGIVSKAGDKYLDIMPPFIAYGVVCGIHNPLSERQEIVIIPKLDREKFPYYLKKYKPNHVIGVPALFESMLKSKELTNMDMSFLQNLICGGDRLTTSSENSINEFLQKHNSNAKVAQGYGMTEVGTSVTYTLNRGDNKLANHIGMPLVFTNIKIVSPGTQIELKYNETGEICISTPSLMLGYFKNEAETSKVLKQHEDGNLWIHSQDIGSMNEDGELFFVDRMKRMIIRLDGHNVWPGAIEQIICTHPAVESCIVIGLPSLEASNGLIPTAVIVLKKEYLHKKEEILKEIDDLCKTKLPERDKAQNYLLRESLPKTTVGKVDFKKVEEEETQKVKKLSLLNKSI